jgi:hypothetical protein
MAYRIPQWIPAALWELVRAQHGVVSRAQLLASGCHPQWIKRQLARGLLDAVLPGVYAVGRPDLTREGRWMAAILGCGRGAVLSHESAATLWGLRRGERAIEVSVPLRRGPAPRGILVHRRTRLDDQVVTIHRAIPVTSVALTLVDLAVRIQPVQLEAAVNEADKLDRVDPESLLAALDAFPYQPGVRPLRELLERGRFFLTDSELERRFIPIARAAGLPPPGTQRQVNGFRVDFYWPELGLVVETDGLRYHRTPMQQARDRVRDQAHLAAGLMPLRFTHAQVRYEPAYVRETLEAVANRRRRPLT